MVGMTTSSERSATQRHMINDQVGGEKKTQCLAISGMLRRVLLVDIVCTCVHDGAWQVSNPSFFFSKISTIAQQTDGRTHYLVEMSGRILKLEEERNLKES